MTWEEESAVVLTVPTVSDLRMTLQKLVWSVWFYTSSHDGVWISHHSSLFRAERSDRQDDVADIIVALAHIALRRESATCSVSNPAHDPSATTDTSIARSSRTSATPPQPHSTAKPPPRGLATQRPRRRNKPQPPDAAGFANPQLPPTSTTARHCFAVRHLDV